MSIAPTDQSENEISSGTEPFSEPQAAATNYTLISSIERNNVSADGIQQNQITYILTSPTLPISNQAITFAVYGDGAHLSTEFGITNASGLFTLGVTSTVAGEVLVVATLVSDPTVIDAELLVFTPAQASYQLTLFTNVDNSPGDGHTYNIVVARVVNSTTQVGAIGQTLTVYINGPASYINNVVTDNAGNAYIYITSTATGPMQVSVVLQSNPSVQSTIYTTFSTGYPIYFPQHEVYLSGNVPISQFLRPYTLQQTHLYELRYSRTPTSIGNCAVNYALVPVNATFACRTGYGNDLIFYNNGITSFKPLKNGSGANFYSQRYPTYNAANTGYSTVQLIDHGPSDTFAGFNHPHQLNEEGFLQYGEQAEPGEYLSAIEPGVQADASFAATGSDSPGI